jgi:hypothetical protein
MDEAEELVFLDEMRALAGAVLYSAARQVGGDAGLDGSAVAVGHHVDPPTH